MNQNCEQQNGQQIEKHVWAYVTSATGTPFRSLVLLTCDTCCDAEKLTCSPRLSRHILSLSTININNFVLPMDTGCVVCEKDT